MACLLAGVIAHSATAAGPKKEKGAIDSQKVTIQLITKGDPIAGKAKSEAERCQECHGHDGHGAEAAIGSTENVAKLAGQYSEYIIKQVRDFRSGSRKHDFMAIMSKSIDDADLVDIAAYFSSQRKMEGDGARDNPIAKNLFVNGDASRNILPCISCHGEGGKGASANTLISPVIGGQQSRYLYKQLLDFRAGERTNSADGVMNKVTKSLSDAEIEALSNYISGL